MIVFGTALTSFGAAAVFAALPCFPPGRFTLNAKEAIDGKTGLIWQRESLVAANWANAKSYCPTLPGENLDYPV